MIDRIIYRFKGRFISQKKAQTLLHLPSTKNKVSIEKISSPTYRYKGRFISETRYKKLQSLPTTKKYTKADIAPKTVKKSKPSIAELTRKALDKDREKLLDRLKPKIKMTESQQTREEMQKRIERAKADVIARDIARESIDTGREITDILSDYSADGEIDSMIYYGQDDISGLAESYTELGDDLDYLDFEMADFEDIEKYESAA